MNVTCDKCGKKYVVADDKVAGKASVKIRCKQCQNLITISGTGSMPAAVAAAPAASAAPAAALGGSAAAGEPNPWEEERTRAMPALDMQATWFAMIQGKQSGPFDLKQLEARVTAGEVTLRTYLWKPGMGDWKRASDVPEVSPVFAGVSVGATATGPVAPAPAVSKPAAADVAVANETPVQSTGRTTGQQAAYQPEPAAAAAVSTQEKTDGAGAQLNDLFGDVSGLAPTGETDQAKPADATAKSAENPADPFAALSGNDKQLPPPGEATKFFIAQAGVNKRNPPWKIALFFISLIGLPTAVLYLLSTLHIVTVTRVNEKGEEVQQPFFSAEGIAGLKDMLSGEAAKQKAAAEEAAAKRRAEAAAAAALANRNKDPKPDPGTPDPVPNTKPANPDLAALYNENNGVGTSVLHVRRGEDGSGKTVATSGLSDEAAGKVVSANIKAFESCIDNALRRNPNLAVGSIKVVLTVGPSGSVKSAAISPKKHETADWALCMMDKGKRLVFPSSDGDTDLELPFKVGVALP